MVNLWNTKDVIMRVLSGVLESRCPDFNFFEGGWKMHQIEVKVFDSEFVERLLAGLFHFVRMVGMIPQFARDEQFVAFHHFADRLLQCFSHFRFV